jgi:hypothetical protein
LPEGTEIGKGFHSSSNGNVTGLNYVMNSTTSTILFDVCINGDQVYSGDYADGKTCIHPSCGESRYTECSVPSCPSRGEQRDQSLCHHANRSPRRTLTYRPFTSLIIELLSQPGFETAINYKDINLEKDSEAYVDLLCGEQPQKHIKQMNKKAKKYLKEMKKNFQKKQAEHDANVSNEELISIVLILGLSYDGVQIFKRKTSHFWPLFFEILNLPPTFRIKHGVGLFLVGLLCGYTGDHIEDDQPNFVYTNHMGAGCPMDKILRILAADPVRNAMGFDGVNHFHGWELQSADEEVRRALLAYGHCGIQALEVLFRRDLSQHRLHKADPYMQGGVEVLTRSEGSTSSSVSTKPAISNMRSAGEDGLWLPSTTVSRVKELLNNASVPSDIKDKLLNLLQDLPTTTEVDGEGK